MNVTPTQTQKILTGGYTFSQLGFSLMITRLKGVYAKDSSPATLQKCASEINVFLEKFSMIMAADFAMISKL
ncbi:MAG: hypothetical protein LBK98_05695 [Peptococcaceae bacterium]|jgi:hypothetical protein|nr:hypothetical protein [Peptococcaceae bacterium]